MNTRQLEYILAIAEEKNILRASEKLFISQSTLSQTLLNLEKELGTPLFIRNPRELSITEAGQYYIGACKDIMHIKEQTYERIRNISNMGKERYRVGISSQEGMERFLTASGIFQKKYPNVELYATDESAKNLLKKLNMGQLALIITSLDSLQKITLPYKVLSREEILLLVPKSLPYKSGGENHKLKWELLKSEHFILSKQNSTMRSITDHIFKQLGVNPDIVCELDNTSATIHMVAEGIGLAFLPKGLKVENEHIRYVSLMPKVYRYQVVIYQEELALNHKMTDFIDML